MVAECWHSANRKYAECLGGNTRQSCRLPSVRYNTLGKHKALGIFTVSRSVLRFAVALHACVALHFVCWPEVPKPSLPRQKKPGMLTQCASKRNPQQKSKEISPCRNKGQWSDPKDAMAWRSVLGNISNHSAEARKWSIFVIVGSCCSLHHVKRRPCRASGASCKLSIVFLNLLSIRKFTSWLFLSSTL